MLTSEADLGGIIVRPFLDLSGLSDARYTQCSVCTEKPNTNGFQKFYVNQKSFATSDIFLIYLIYI